jgi:prepilin-type N-terminal cleavage/methylation domain-containing protein
MSSYMNKHKLNSFQNYRVQGFTLLELLTGMTITTVVAGLALQALVRTQGSFTEDQKKIESGQKMSSVLEIIGREVRQAGELIVEPNYPTVVVKPRGARGASIILYRAVSEPVFICKDYPAAAAIDGFLFAIDNKVATPDPSCNKPPSDIASFADVFPPNQQTGWVETRNLSTTRVAANPVVLGTIYDVATQSVQPFVYNGESSPAYTAGGSLNLKIGTVSFAPPAPINIGNTAYIVIKKEYLVCSNELRVRTNSKVEATAGGGDADPACTAPNATTDPTATLDTVATNIEKLDITMVTRLVPTNAVPNPPAETQALNAAFPIMIVTSPRGWHNIQGVTIQVKGIDPLGRNLASLPALERQRIEQSFSSQGNFYPRNALSAK